MLRRIGSSVVGILPQGTTTTAQQLPLARIRGADVAIHIKLTQVLKLRKRNDYNIQKV